MLRSCKLVVMPKTEGVQVLDSWRLHFGTGLVCLTVGVVCFLLPFSGSVSSMDLAVPLYLRGVFIAGIGFGILLSTSAIHRLEKEQQSR